MDGIRVWAGCGDVDQGRNFRLILRLELTKLDETTTESGSKFDDRSGWWVRGR